MTGPDAETGPLYSYGDPELVTEHDDDGPYDRLPPQQREELEWQDRRYAERQRKRARGPDDV